MLARPFLPAPPGRARRQSLTPPQTAALVLAGRRGPDDELARAANAPHRALLDIQGTPMLERVARALHATECIGDVLVSIDEPALLSKFPGLEAMVADGRLRVIASESSPSRSILSALGELPGDRPLLVTTADHALLTPEMVEHFLASAEQLEADVAIGLVAASRIRQRFPHVKRTYLPFRGESYSGANLFAFRTGRARQAAEFWLRAESHRKRPWRLVREFGLGTLVLFLLRALTLERAMLRASKAVGVTIRAVELPFAEAAVDVDKLSDLELVNEVLAG